MNKVQQVIIALLCGMKPQHEILKDVEWNQALGEGLLEVSSLHKSDLFGTTSSGKSFFEYKETWDNLKKLIAVLQRNGEDVTFQDFSKAVIDTRTPAKMAETCGALEQLFDPDLWKGHEREMMRLWYNVAKDKRDKYDFLRIRRAVASGEGRELREDQLARAGITTEQMRVSMTSGNLDVVRDKLAAHGDHMRVADVMLLDGFGDFFFDNKTNWNGFDKVVAELMKHGEKFEPWHFTIKFGERKTLLEQALHHDVEFKLFNTDMWKGRPAAMMEVYDAIPADKKHRIKIQPLLQDLYNDMYGRVEIGPNFALDDLTQAHDIGHGKAIRLLGLSSIWERFGEFQDALQAKGQKLTLAHLRLPSGTLDESCLNHAVRGGHLNQVVSVLDASGEKLDAKILLDKKEGQTQSLLDLIAETHQHKELFKPAYWVGRGQDLIQVWEALPQGAKNEIDFKAIHGEVNRLSLRQKFGTRAPGFNFG